YLVAIAPWIFAGGALYGITGVFIAELFDTRVRYSGISVGFQIGAMLSGALAPMIATALLHWRGGASWPVASFLAILSLISLVAIYLASDRYRVRIHGQEPVV